MSIPLTQIHPAMRAHLTDLNPELQYYNSQRINPASYSLHAPMREPLDQPTGSPQAQLPPMAASIAQTNTTPFVHTHEGDTAWPDSMDPFIDATVAVGPTSFGVLKIRNVSPKMQDDGPAMFPTPADLGKILLRGLFNLRPFSYRRILYALHSFILQIPYDVLAKEIVHFLGRSPNIIDNHTMGCAVHIIMERPTSKTMDCFVEFQTVESVREQIRRHDNLVQSGRHPKIGSRHVHVEESDQNELLAEMFPRAKSIVWQQGAPVVVTNDDPYSTGFKGFFTREEMVGLVRHAECPQRFPWYASELYTLADRNLLFNTYMNQMCVLVEKVEKTDTKGLDQNLLRDFIFAGMNCPGFGERQKHELITTAGYWGSAIMTSPLNCFWPFDLISRQPGMDDETVKSFLDLVELGVDVHQNGVPFKERLIVQPRTSTTALPEHPYFLNNTRFQFNEESQSLDYGTAMGIEMRLMQELLSTGYASVKEQNENSQDSTVANSQRQLAENLRMLQVQEQEILQGEFRSESTPRAPLSPAQSPKGTTAAVTNASGHINITPTGKTSKSIDPTSKPFEPRRRLSEPQQPSGGIGDSPMHDPFRRRTSSTLSLPFPDDTPTTTSPRKHAEYVTPTKSKKGARVSVDHTIHEEDDEDLFMAINNANQQKPS